MACRLAIPIAALLHSTEPWSQEKQPAVQTCQRSTFKIALDVGHDRIRSGAISARGNSEFSYNLVLARLALRAVQEAGFRQAFLIGESGEPMSLNERPRIARDEGAALFISLHHDSAQRQYFSEWTFEG
jgi:N-acetylmuramoyl-L-alanine amidase